MHRQSCGFHSSNTLVSTNIYLTKKEQQNNIELAEDNTTTALGGRSSLPISWRALKQRFLKTPEPVPGLLG